MFGSFLNGASDERADALPHRQLLCGIAASAVGFFIAQANVLRLGVSSGSTRYSSYSHGYRWTVTVSYYDDAENNNLLFTVYSMAPPS